MCKQEAACHELWSKKEKIVAELMELCGDLPDQAQIVGDAWS